MSRSTEVHVGKPAIKDQGRRGTCVACAASAAHEIVCAEGIDLSIEFLHWASKRRDTLSKHLEGTTLPAAKEALDHDGQPPEEAWPYDDTRDQWSSTYQPPAGATDEAKRRRLNGGELIAPTAEAIRGALDRGRPVVVGVTLYATWHSVESDGVISLPSSVSRPLGGHAVLVAGYRGDDFIIQNSWGSDWGNGGSAYLPSGYLDRYAISAWALAR